MRRTLLTLALLACGVPEPEFPEECADTCGTTWTGEAWRVCEPCLDDDDLTRPMKSVQEVFDLLWERSYMQDVIPLDRESVLAHAAEAFRTEPDRSVARMSAQWRVVQAFANGHMGIYRTDTLCSEQGGVDPGWSSFDACTVPFGDDFVLTGDAPSLGLQAGERIVGINTLRGSALIDWLLAGPLCSSGAGHPAAAHEVAADALMGRIRKGDVLTVQNLDGQERSVTVGAPGERIQCRPLSPQWIEGRVRADGVAVLRIHRWILYESDPGFAGADYEATMANMIAEAETVFDAITPDATGLIIDIRGNGGGYSPVGFAIAQGMPGARSHHLATCRFRQPGTDDPIYTGELVYQLEPDDRFAFDGRVAVLTNGHSVSASDYFALALKESTDARLFGRPTRGAYGGGAPGTPLERTNHTVVSIDTARCDDAFGEPLETLGVQPDAFVDPTPADLAAGIDTVEERAAAWVLLP